MCFVGLATIYWLTTDVATVCWLTTDVATIYWLTTDVATVCWLTTDVATVCWLTTDVATVCWPTTDFASIQPLPPSHKYPLPLHSPTVPSLPLLQCPSHTTPPAAPSLPLPPTAPSHSHTLPTTITGGSTDVGGACLVVMSAQGLLALPAPLMAMTMYW